MITTSIAAISHSGRWRVMFGAGIPIFADRGYSPQNAELTASLRFQSGVVINEYRFN